MKTILAIDDDVLVAAMAIAQSDDRDLGQVISDLARRALPRLPQDEISLILAPKNEFSSLGV